MFILGNIPILHAADLELLVSERLGPSLVTPESGEREGTQQDSQHSQSRPAPVSSTDN